MKRPLRFRNYKEGQVSNFPIGPYLNLMHSQLRHLFSTSWWVILFLLLCYMCYEKTLYRWNNEFYSMKTRLETIKVQKNNALLVQDDLILQINSQSDPEWVELTLMRGLGLVPEGQIKVYFNNKT